MPLELLCPAHECPVPFGVYPARRAQPCAQLLGWWLWGAELPGVSTAPQTAFCGKAVVKSDVSQALVGNLIVSTEGSVR